MLDNAMLDISTINHMMAETSTCRVTISQAIYDVAKAIGRGLTNLLKTITFQHDIQYGDQLQKPATMPHAAAMAQGLEDILNPPERGNDASEFGQRFTSADRGKIFNGYVVEGDKSKGVEPGFVARKVWGAKQDKDVTTPDSKMNTAACRWLEAHISSKGRFLDKNERRALASLFKNALRETGGPNQSSLTQLESLSGDKFFKVFQAKIKLPDQALMNHVLGCLVTTQTEEMAVGRLAKYLKIDLQSHSPELMAKHYIKLDFLETDSMFGQYTIPSDKAKGALHRFIRYDSVKNINQGAVNETLANDLMREMGMKSQDLKIVQAKYSDGTPKLMLDGTHIDGFADFDGENHAQEGALYLKDGYLVRNTRLDSDPPGKFSGPPALHTGIEDLGSKKMLLLLMADYDALGSKGGNKGYVGDQFFAIDPGHALDNSMLNRRDICSDASFIPKVYGLTPVVQQASSSFATNYKNFTMFDQVPFSEKMEGVRRIQEMRNSGRDADLFDVYKTTFDQPEEPTLNFQADIQLTKQAYLDRQAYILDVFAERLAVDDYQFYVGAKEHRQLRDQTLNLLDGLEKLTSKTVGKSGKEEGVALMIPAIRKPEHRKEWHVSQNSNDGIEFSYHATSEADSGEVLASLSAYFAATWSGPLPFSMNIDDKHHITLTVKDPAQVGAVQSKFTYEMIMNHKHGE